MPKSVYVTTPFPTVEEVAQRLGVPDTQVRELVDLADRLMASREKESTAKRSAAKKSTKKRARKKSIR